MSDNILARLKDIHTAMQAAHDEAFTDAAMAIVYTCRLLIELAQVLSKLDGPPLDEESELIELISNQATTNCNMAAAGGARQ